MKDLIKKILKEETEKVLEIPGLNFFPDGVEGLKNFIEKKNIKRWSLDDDLDLRWYKGDFTWLEGLVSVSGYLYLYGTPIKSLPNLQSVGGYLELRETQIKDLGNLQSVNGSLYLSRTQISLGNLQTVGGYLNLYGTQIKSFGNLKSVGGSLLLNKFLTEKYTDEEIRSMINVAGDIRRP
jgi:hypothetical protein